MASPLTDLKPKQTKSNCNNDVIPTILADSTNGFISGIIVADNADVNNTVSKKAVAKVATILNNDLVFIFVVFLLINRFEF